MKNFLTKLEEKVKAAEERWEESKETVDEGELQVLRAWLMETVQEQFLSKVPDNVKPGSTFRIETDWYVISIDEGGYKFEPHAFFPERRQLKEFLAEFTAELSDIVKRKVEYEIDEDRCLAMLIRFCFYW